MKNGFNTTYSIYLIFFACLFLLSCNNEAKAPELTKYYFPVNELHEQSGDGLVYIYQVQVDTSVHFEYWYYKAFDRDGSTYLSATQYDTEGNVSLLTIEEVVANGTILSDFRAYNSDNSGYATFTRGEIEHGDVFPFEAETGLWFVTNVQYKNPADTLEDIRWIRNRNFIGFDRLVLDSDTLQVAVFENIERFEMDHPFEGSANPQAKSTQWFANNLGLVYYEKNFEDYLYIRGELKDRISMDEFKSKIKAAYDKPGS